jgi:hypothetical protein
MEAIDPMSGKAVWRTPLYGEMIASAMLATGGVPDIPLGGSVWTFALFDG